MKTLVLGLGNPILVDDSVGLTVSRAISEMVKDDNIDATRHTTSPHDATLTDALAVGAKLGFPVPNKIAVVVVEIPDVCDTFTEDCSAEAEKAIPEAVKMVLAEIGS